MKSILRLSSLLAAAVASTAVADDDLFQDRYSHDMGKAVISSNRAKAQNLFIEATGGAIFGVSGDYLMPLNQTIPSHVFTGYHKGGSRPDATIAKLSYDDVFGAAQEYSLRFGRRMGTGAFYVRVSHTQAGGSDLIVGDIDGRDLTARFDDYDDWGILMGFQAEFMQPAKLHPYAGFEAGARFVNSMGIGLSAEHAHQSYSNLPLYDDSVVFTVGITFGAAYDITPNFRVGVETGLRYQTQLDQVDSSLEELGLERINGGDGFTSVPLFVTGRWSF